MKCLITGISGQDGKILADILKDSTDVFGTSRTDSKKNVFIWDQKNIDDLKDLLAYQKFDTIVNLSAPSIGNAIHSTKVDFVAGIIGVVDKLLRAIVDVAPNTVLIQASSSLIQASSSQVLLSSSLNTESYEISNQLSLYGAAKKYADELIGYYRKNHGVHASSVILYPHISEYSPKGSFFNDFLSQVDELVDGRTSKIMLNNLNFTRDWADASDYMKCVASLIRSKNVSNVTLSTGVLTCAEKLVSGTLKQMNIPMSEVEIINPDAKWSCGMTNESKDLFELNSLAVTDIDDIIRRILTRKKMIRESF